MGKPWQIFKFEYARHVFRWRFLLSLLYPFAGSLLVGIVLVITFLTQMNLDPVGYVDYAQVFDASVISKQLYVPLNKVEFLPYPDETAARAALDKKKIQAYFVIPADFYQNGRVRMVYYRLPHNGVEAQFYTFLRIHFLKDQPVEIMQRVINGPAMRIQITSDGPMEKINYLLHIVIPILLSYLAVFTIGQCSGYLSQALVEEKENRSIEILTTSASPMVIITGKLFGLVSVGLTQLMFWGGFLLAGFFLFLVFSPMIANAIDRLPILLLALTIIPSFILFCCLILMGVILSGNSRGGQSFSMMIIFAIQLPFFFSGMLSEDWSGWPAIFLSFFPLTATSTLALRLAFASVPIWQILAIIFTLVLAAVVTFWLTVRGFRRSQLLTGRQIEWKRILHVMRFIRVKRSEV